MRNLRRTSEFQPQSEKARAEKRARAFDSETSTAGQLEGLVYSAAFQVKEADE